MDDDRPCFLLRHVNCQLILECYLYFKKIHPPFCVFTFSALKEVGVLKNSKNKNVPLSLSFFVVLLYFNICLFLFVVTAKGHPFEMYIVRARWVS